MKLVYTATGKEVKVGDMLTVENLDRIRVESFCEPHKASSSGKVTIMFITEQGWDSGNTAEYYVSVIGARWIDRTDRTEKGYMINRIARKLSKVYTVDSKLSLSVQKQLEKFSKVGIEQLMTLVESVVDN